MTLVLVFIALTFIIELSLRGPVVWQHRATVAYSYLLCNGVLAGLAIIALAYPWNLTVVLAVVFRILNAWRLIVGRAHEQHLYVGFQRTAIFVNTLLVAGIIVSWSPPLLDHTWLAYMTLGQFSLAILLLAFIAHSINQTRYHGHTTFLTDKELPSVSVVIPARNETADLAACIESVLASNYPKLEILVLDDCSHDKTPDIIKHYAHGGVRFIQGSPPTNGWLPKNQAYSRLTDEANGSYLVFCGVDVRMSADFLRKLVTHTMLKKKSMVSVMPMRLASSLRSSFIQPMRYWWELSLPRKFLNRPPVLSTCWIIEAKTLAKHGGMAAVRKSILPERYFARECVHHGDSYSFVRANEQLDLRTVKSPESQVSTALRVRYPQFQQRPENILMLILVLQVGLLMPYGVFVGSFFFELPEARLISGMTIVALSLAHAIIMTVSNPTNSLIALINFPFVILSETAIAIYSMLQYEFGTVMWKGRNICDPVMQSDRVPLEHNRP
jgi:glycosyltransferase involved in cell wall biosynthesis